jgi:hypothetical protein
MYQVAPDRPWGFNVAASLNGREGYSNPYWVASVPTPRASGHAFRQRRRPSGRSSNDDLHILDLRVEKEFKFDRVGLTLGADVFNVMNEGTVLQRQIRLGLANSDHVQEVVSPRIFRLGAKLSFN